MDTTAVVWSALGRTGLYFVEHGPPPRGITVYYDRAGSACSTLEPDDLDWGYVRNARWIHLTGITPALGEGCARTIARAIQVAKAAGVRVAFDVNLRRKLWTAERARAALDPMLGGLDLLIATEEDARDVFGFTGGASDAAVRLRERFKATAAVVTAGASGAYLADGDEVTHEPALSAAEVDPVGRGDAFAAGLLWGALEGNLQTGLRYGAALAALAQTYWGDVGWSTKEDVMAALAGRGPKPIR